jgi:hypothetical protein
MALRYNLVLCFHENMNLADFVKIGKYVRALDPEIHVYVVPREEGLRDYRAKARPTLIFCPRSVQRGRFPNGKIYCGQPISKTEQMKIMSRQGLPVPRWQTIVPGAQYKAEEWGPIVVTKPTALGSSSYSRGVAASRPEDLSYVPPGSFPEGHPGRDSPMLIQQFINTGPYPAQIRVLTLFGEPLYAEKIQAEEPHPIPEPATAESVAAWTITPVTVKRVRSFVHDDDVLRLARRAYGAFPDVPLQACDIIREEATKKLFILEINPGGNTWHFSSQFAQSQRIDGRRREEQFDAFRVAARVLAERTRNEAR